MVGKKTVAIIGAGPAGLATAKCMVDAGLVPTVFDKAPVLGGMWNPASSACWSSLRTNLSHYTCSFSDFPWGPGAEDFPTQRDVLGYLEAYTGAFLRPEHLSLGCKVTSVEPAPEHPGGAWAVRWSSPDQGASSSVFDHAVVATGFFSAPNLPRIPGLDAFPGKAVHSSGYRSPEEFCGKRVLVVGASVSGVEIAAELAPHTAGVTIVMPRPVWVVPPYLPTKPGSRATPFAPIDLASFRRMGRGGTNEVIFRNEAMYNKMNGGFRLLLGKQPESLGEPDPNTPPFLATSQAFLGHVRAGKIDVRMGKLGELQGATPVLKDGSCLEDVDGIVLCTGYVPSLPFLPANVRASIIDPEEVFVPVLLHRGVFHPRLPGMAFVGMYRAPHFGIMELQARWAAAVFSGALPVPPDDVQEEGIAVERAVREQRPRPQFPHSDYVGLGDGLARELGTLPSDDWLNKHDSVVPGYYRGGKIAEASAARVEAALEVFARGRMVARTASYSLQGQWNFSRTIDSKLPSSPSGTVVGHASFTPTKVPNEYLYAEEGEFVFETEHGTTSAHAKREYVYAYDVGRDKLEVFFVGKPGTRGAPFLSLDVLPPAQGEEADAWVAVAEHLCGQDTYMATYRFAFAGVQLAKMEIQFKVTGPTKDYVATAVYTR